MNLLSVCARLSSGKSISANKLNKNGIIPVFGGNGVRGYVSDEENFNGECAIVGRQGAYCGNVRYYTGKAYMTEHAIVIQANELADTRFLAYKLSLMQLGRLSGQSAQPGLSVKVLGEQVLEIPPLPIQRKIASILSALDDKIETNNAICRNLEEQARALFKSWFIDYEPFGGIVRQGWSYGCLGDIVTFNPRLPKGKFKGSFVDMKSLPHTGYAIERISKKPDATGTRFQNYDVLLARITPCLENGKTGMVWGLDDDEVAMGSTEFIVMRGSDMQLSSYIACIARDESFRDYAIKRMNGSSGRQRVQASDIALYPVVIPPRDVLVEFEKLISPLFSGMKECAIEASYLSSLRDALIPRLMRGAYDGNRLGLWR